MYLHPHYSVLLKTTLIIQLKGTRGNVTPLVGLAPCSWKIAIFLLLVSYSTTLIALFYSNEVDAVLYPPVTDIPC